MKRLLYLIGLIILALTPKLYAQEVSKLTVPGSPAFSILEFNPSVVMRPTNGKALSTDILNAFDKDGKLLMNLGLEVMPYWLNSHPTLKQKDYLNPDFGHTILQSLTFSAATVKDSASGNNKLGAGFRFKLYNGQPVADEGKLIAAVKEKTTITAVINGAISTLAPADTRLSIITDIGNNLNAAGIPAGTITVIKQKLVELSDSYTDGPASIRLFLRDFINKQEAAYQDLVAKTSDLLYQRKGLIIEMAGASGFNSSKNNSLEKIGTWVNCSYTVSPDDYITFTSRYLFNHRDTAITNFDSGFGFLKKTKDFNISIEMLWRYQSAEIADLNIKAQPITRIERSHSYRLAAQGAFRVAENISLNLSFGKDFDSPGVTKSGFFSILGLNYSVFNKPTVKAD